MTSTHIILLETYMDILHPLMKWRVLSLDKVIKEIGYNGKMSNFYKKIFKLGKAGFIKSFINPATKKKEIFLSPQGFKALGESTMTPIGSESCLHESVTSELAYAFSQYSFVKNVMLEHDILKSNPMIQFKPDALLECELKSTFNIAVECELTQKSKKRILEKYTFYKSNSHFNNVIYVFPVKRIYQTYIEVLRENSKTIPSDFFLFLYCPQMFQRNFDLLKSEVTHKFSLTTLENLFSNRGRI